MQLFAINRYDGDDKERDESREKKKLDKLLRKVEKRKRKLEQEKQSGEESKDENKPEEKKTRDEQHNAEMPDNSGCQQEEETMSIEETSQVKASNFQVLGADSFDKKTEAKMVLPLWLRNPTIIINEISSESVAIDDYHELLSPVLVQNMKALNIKQLFPVQKEVIPWILDAHEKPFPFRPRDICVSAATGSGKTLAFAVPIVQLLLNRVICRVRALIILPAIELASQVYKVFKTLTKNTKLTVGLLSTTIPFEAEQKLVVDQFLGKHHSKLDIVVSTPGRLVEHLHSTQGFELKSLRFLVIDEADRIMEESHHNWLYHLDEHLKTTPESFMTGRSIPLCINQLLNQAVKQPHKMLFSATLTQDPEKLQNLRLFQPKLFTSIVKSGEELVDQIVANASMKREKRQNEEEGDFIGKYTTPAELKEYCVITQPRFKPLTLYALLLANDWKRFLCFTNTTEAAKRLAFVMQDLFKSENKIADLSAALKPGVRNQIFKDFIKGKIHGIICTDALSRGIDVADVDVVISYEAPRNVKTYIHRVGRTARAGRPGTAVTILTSSEVIQFNKTLDVAKKPPLPELKSNVELEEKYAQKYADSLDALQAYLIQDEHIKSVRTKKDKKVAATTEASLMNQLQGQIGKKITEQQITTVLTDSEEVP